MEIGIGVVGPHDLTDEVAVVCEQQPGVTVWRFDYDHESQAPAIVDAQAGRVTAWLFTGVVPYTLAQNAGVLNRPAAYVDYTGDTLLQAVVRLGRDGHDVARISIDTLATADVLATLGGAGIPPERIRTLPYRAGISSADVVAFHRRMRRGPAGASAAITCLSSAYEVLRGEMPALRLVPSTRSVRVALRQLVLQADSQLQEDAQVALGLVDLDGGPERLLKEVAALGGTVARSTGGNHLLVTTRGPLYEATGGFTALPMARRLVDGGGRIHIGLGLGRSAAEADSLARRALGRARRVGPVAAVLSLRSGTDIVLETTAPPPAGATDPAVIAQRVGLSTSTLERLRAAHRAAGAKPLTTREVAERLGVQQRTARRMLYRLQLAGLAERVGVCALGESGRPLTLYQLTL